MLSRIPRRFLQQATMNVKPLPAGHADAKKPIYVDGKRAFPPTVDDFGNVTYYHEFPADWKPWSLNFVGHGWIIAT